MLAGMSKPLQHIPRFQQGKFERDGDFMRRVELETQRVLQQSKLDSKFKVSPWCAFTKP